MTERSQPINSLADALHDCVEPPGRTERTERLAAALQACLNEAARTGAKAAREEIKREFEPRFDRQDEALRTIREHMDIRLDRRDESIRMVWKQVKGNGKLPIDD